MSRRPIFRICSSHIVHIDEFLVQKNGEILRDSFLVYANKDCYGLTFQSGKCETGDE
jgi:hypothetical protein